MSTRSLGTGPASILVVDDKPANLQLMECMLHHLGYAVRLAASGALALQAARARAPDMILLDVRMPGMDGYEVCVQLKADAQLRPIPVIFVSGLTETEDRTKAFQVGGIDYVTKPLQMEEVGARLRTHLDIQRLRREAEAQNIRLEHTVENRTRELREANASLSRLEQAKTDFLAVISHELRTPLGILFGTMELALGEFPDHPGFHGYTQLFEESRRRLLQSADDALLLSSLQVHQLRFSRPGGNLTVEMRAAGDEVSITFNAEGYSVPAEEWPRFFAVLTIGKAIAHGGDLGLAPAVAAQIISLMGGRVEIANVPSPGIRLVAWLPGGERQARAKTDRDGGKESE